MKTIVIASVVIAAIAAILAIAPVAAPMAMAIRQGGTLEQPSCTHNGNGAPSDSTPPDCGPGQSSQDTSTTLVKCHGKFYPEGTSPCGF